MLFCTSRIFWHSMNENCVLNGNGHPRVLESLFYKENSTDYQEISKSIDILAGLLSKHLNLAFIH